MADVKWPIRPWRFDENMELWDAEGNYILEIEVLTHEDVEMAEATGRLLAAAPDLYAALNDIVSGYGGGATTDEFWDHVRGCIKPALAALAKARGSQ
jgi:hypothetical protein